MAALAGMTKLALAVVMLGREIEVPLMFPPMVTLMGTTFKGGFGGDEGSVMVTVTVVPRAALPPGAEAVVVPPPDGV